MYNFYKIELNYVQYLIPTLKQHTLNTARYWSLLDSWGVVLGEIWLGVSQTCTLLFSKLIFTVSKSPKYKGLNYDVNNGERNKVR